MTYDSTQDTLEHRRQVRMFLNKFISEIIHRQVHHDDSKLQSPEKEAFDKMTPRLRELEYGSDEYREALREMNVAIRHHYENNTHHPEHYENGICGMDLLDIIEMLADWKAASLRHATGSMSKSMEINRERFGISDQLYIIFLNTINRFGW